MSEVKNTSATKPSAVIEDAEAKQKAFHAQCLAEAKAFSQIRSDSRKAGRELKFGALVILAQTLGESASKMGKPSEAASDDFLGAMTARKLSFEQRAELARKANASVPEGHKPVAVITGKASAERGSQTYRFNLPVGTAEALG